MPTSPTTSEIEHLRRAALRDGAGLGDGELLGCFLERHDEAAFAALIKRLRASGRTGGASRAQGSRRRRNGEPRDRISAKEQ
jgi:hypothetical protein